VPGHFTLFNGFDLAVTAHVSFLMGFEGCVKKSDDQLLRQRGADHAAAKADHVHVVVLDALVSRIRIVDQCGIDAWNLVGSNARPDSAPAYDDAALGGAAQHVLRNRLGVYQEQTAPLVAYYAGKGLLKTVDGMEPVEQVTDAIKAAITH